MTISNNEEYVYTYFDMITNYLADCPKNRNNEFRHIYV